MESTILQIAIGIGLSAACGFRIFVPLLILNLAARSGYLTLADHFEWMASTPALVIFATATVLEIAAYYVPFIDNVLDVAATPSAIVAGILVTASQVTHMDPVFGWSVAIIAGGGAAGAVQGVTTMARSLSSMATAGFGNPLVSTVEAAASVVTAVLAIVWPLIAVFLLLLFALYAGKKLYFRRPQGPMAESA